MANQCPALGAVRTLLIGGLLLVALSQATAFFVADKGFVAVPHGVTGSNMATEIEIPTSCTSEDSCQSPDCHSAIIAALDPAPAAIPPGFWAAGIGGLSGAPGFCDPDPPRTLS